LRRGRRKGKWTPCSRRARRARAAHFGRVVFRGAKAQAAKPSAPNPKSTVAVRMSVESGNAAKGAAAMGMIAAAGVSC
jgi:hypothetical protein